MESLRRLFRLKSPISRQDEETLADQANLLFYLSLLFAATGIGNTVFIVSNFQPMNRPFLPVLGVLIIIVYGFILAAAFAWRRHRKAIVFLERARLLYVALGTCWGIFIIALAHYGTANQHALIVGLALGVVSTPIICIPATVAFCFFVPVSLLSVVAVTLTGFTDQVTAIAFTCYTLYAIVGIVCTNLAYDGRSRAQAALRREVATVSIFLREYQEGSSDWLWETDADGCLVQMPPALAPIMETSITSSARPRLSFLLQDSEDGAMHRELAGSLQKGIAFRDLKATALDGARRRWFTLTGHPLHDKDGRMSGFRGIGRDITARHEADARLAYLARHDGLTGLLNRQEILTQIEAACAKGGDFALASIDLDDFKTINDTFGHQLGDELLIAIANEVTAALGPKDVCGRLGGDEFAVLFAGLTLDEACTAATRLVERLTRRMVLRGHSVSSSACAGVAASEGPSSDAKRLFFMADLALYKAKSEGKSAVRCFRPEFEAEYNARFVEESELARAIEDGEIRPVFQPIADLFTGQVMCLEALARWQHPELGMVSPAKFIPVAERGGLIDRLGEQILEESLRQAAEWPDEVQVNVNLSPKQLVSGRFPATLARILSETGLRPSRVGIEITENIFVDFSQSVLDQLTAIREQGVRLVLDDFGTGYSSLGYLQKINVDGLKIDASFLRQIPDRKVEAIIRTITQLTADLNIHLVAEGIENTMQLDWLRSNGIHFGQGFLLGRPKADPPTQRIDLLP
ncbi:bifunctional diguanylate cyclase/phosphodiesterase [Fulvimarina endophytica]|uniref:Bifunctional diguanylate cyclase/phosphodiesterase n=2 Tax=Fulvimarina endophytica TaxID=2293836 RepID=A0A371X7R0_9HYPH|nr:bifunctional diguanylate cyclase/phosphodiesterase [Fulvimarina endophytica]